MTKPDIATGLTLGLGLGFLGSLLAQLFLLLPPAVGFAWLVLLGGAVYRVHRRPARAAAAVGLRPLGPASRLAWAAVPATLLLGIGVSGLVWVWAGPMRFPIPQREGNPIEAYIGTPGGWLTFTFYAALVAPLIEELAFRGWVQRTLGRRFGAVAGIAVGAILFAVFHLWYSHPQALLVPLILGVIWGAAVHLTRSVWAGVLLHGAWNATLMLIQRSGIDSASFFRWSHPELGLVFAMAMVAGAMGTLALLWRRLPARSRPLASG